MAVKRSKILTFTFTLFSGILCDISAGVSSYQLWNEENVRKSAILNNAGTYGYYPYYVYGQQSYYSITMQQPIDPYYCVVDDHGCTHFYPFVEGPTPSESFDQKSTSSTTAKPSETPEYSSPLLAPKPIRPTETNIVKILEKLCSEALEAEDRKEKDVKKKVRPAKTKMKSVRQETSAKRKSQKKFV